MLARLRAFPQTQLIRGSSYILEGEVPAARIHVLRQQLPALTRGEGVLECAFEVDRYQRVSGEIPTRPRTDHNPLTVRSTCCTSCGGFSERERLTTNEMHADEVDIDALTYRAR